MDGRNGDVCVEERAGAGAPAAPAVAICGLKVGVARVYPGIGGGYNCRVLLGEWRGFFVYFGVDCWGCTNVVQKTVVAECEHFLFRRIRPITYNIRKRLQY